MVPEGVIMDLLPLYMAGEASEDTRHLIEEYLREHPEMVDVTTLMYDDSRDIGAAARSDSAESEKRAFERARRLLRYRGSTLGFAIAYSLAPLTFTVDAKGVTWIMLRDNRALALVFVVTALVFWGIHFALRPRTVRRTQVD
jgi:hypothetical protein